MWGLGIHFSLCFLPVFIFREGCKPLQFPGLVPEVSAVPSLGRKLPGGGTQQAHSFLLINSIMSEFSRSLPTVDQGCLDLSTIYLYKLSRLVLSSGWHYFFLTVQITSLAYPRENNQNIFCESRQTLEMECHCRLTVL